MRGKKLVQRISEIGLMSEDADAFAITTHFYSVEFALSVLG